MHDAIPDPVGSDSGPQGAPSDRRTALGWLLGLAVFVLLFQGSRGLYEPDEGRYTNVALAMLRSGDWTHPYLHHEVPHYAKPPLTYWSLAATIALFGRNEWACRLPHALAFILTICCLYRLGRIFVPGRPWLPALAYALAPLPFAASNVITPDTPLALFTTLGLTAFACFWWPGASTRPRVWLAVMWAAFGLAFLTKGPAGWLPLIAVIVFVWTQERGAGWKRLFKPCDVALCLTLAFSWYAQVALSKPDLLHYFLIDELYNRVATGEHRRNPEWYKPFLIYGPGLMICLLPWAREAWDAAPAAWSRLRSFAKPEARRAHAETFFLTLALLLPLAVLMLIRSRLILYLLPLCAPLILLLARHMRALAFTNARKAWVGFWIVALVGLKFGAARFDSGLNSKNFAAALNGQLVARPYEVVFVDGDPFYGLNFYLDCQVEHLKLAGTSGEELAEEVAEEEPNVVYSVRSKYLQGFCRSVSHLNHRTTVLGNHDEFTFVRLTHDGEAGAQPANER